MFIAAILFTLHFRFNDIVLKILYSDFIRFYTKYKLKKIAELNLYDIVDSVSENLNLIFEYENNGLMISGLQLIINVFKIEKSYIESNKKYIQKRYDL